ncbi:MAG TPA: 3-dehydroquinate synthase [Pyrinomonadaceae bacterium]|nr:3-dehydroquinate synthase [Pyrinomonadaceae bacterium]
MTRRVPVRLNAGRSYEIEIGAGTLARVGATARRVLTPAARRIVVISNRTVFDLYGATVLESLRAQSFNVAHWLMGDGERHKSLRAAEQALAFFSAVGLERSDAVVALGGGVVGDLAGFAAAVYLRGIAFLQAPTTLLAQIDASVGGKTAVNTRAGKNLIGAFHQPRAVVIDTDTLQTLPPRELTAGWCEAIKQGAVGSRRLFTETRHYLMHTPTAEQMNDLLAAQCAFKARIVAGDEREHVGRTDARSRRILNFGHTVGHALEAVTHFRRFRHGEAVGRGMIAAGEISNRLGLLPTSELEYLRATVRRAGRLPRADDLNERALLHALTTDKKSVGGDLQWVLLERLGRARIVSGQAVPTRVVRASLRAALGD